MTDRDRREEDPDSQPEAGHASPGGTAAEAHEHDPLPTSSMVTGAGAAGVWGPRHHETSELAPRVPPDPAPPRERRGLAERLGRLFGHGRSAR